MEYRPEIKYSTVPKDQGSIGDALKATIEDSKAGGKANSIVKLLSVTLAAALQYVDVSNQASMLEVIMSEMAALREEVRGKPVRKGGDDPAKDVPLVDWENELIVLDDCLEL